MCQYINNSSLFKYAMFAVVDFELCNCLYVRGPGLYSRFTFEFLPSNINGVEANIWAQEGCEWGVVEAPQ